MNSKISISIFTCAAFILFIVYIPNDSNASILKGNQISQDISEQNEENSLHDILDKGKIDYDNSMKGITSMSGKPRDKRAMKEDIESGFKEFADKVAKLPDQITGSLKKYFEEKGVSLDSVQKILSDIWNGVEKLISEIKKAL